MIDTLEMNQKETGVLGRMFHSVGRLLQIDWRAEGEFIVLELGLDEE